MPCPLRHPPSSPIKQLFEAIAYETALTRAPDPGEDPAPGRTQDAANLAKGLARIGIELPTGKSQSRAGGAFANAPNPGADIEAQFRPFQILVTGPPGQRPIDALTQNFRDIYQSLQLATTVPSQAERANANLQLQISTLRANASRLPKALANMIRTAADDFEGDAAETSIAQLNRMLNETVTGPCEEVIANRFPFAGSGAEDIPMADFARVFAPNGVIDRFFAQNLSPHADMGGQNWDWNQETRLGRELSKSTLRQFQLAAEIRDVFFPMGGSTPAINITFTPFSLHGDADMALLDVNGQLVQSYQTGNTPGIVTWPGSTSSESVSLSLTPELPGREFGYPVRRSLGLETPAGQRFADPQRRQSGSALCDRRTRCRLHDPGGRWRQSVRAPRVFGIQLSNGALKSGSIFGTAMEARTSIKQRPHQVMEACLQPATRNKSCGSETTGKQYYAAAGLISIMSLWQTGSSGRSMDAPRVSA